jgi:enamine deaminase RidA (YjgF/YER057c/UK114 family)
MIERLNPAGVPKPASAYAQAVVHPAAARRLVVSGQIGVDAAGRAAEGLDAQVALAFGNFMTVVRAAGMGPEHVVKITCFMKAGGDVAVYRRRRDEILEGHAVACSYIEVAGLAAPHLLFEVEGEAVGP